MTLCVRAWCDPRRHWRLHTCTLCRVACRTQLAARKVQHWFRQLRARRRLHVFMLFARVAITRRKRVAVQKHAALARLQWEHRLRGVIAVQRVVRGGIARKWFRLELRVVKRSLRAIAWWWCGACDRCVVCAAVAVAAAGLATSTWRWGVVL